MKYLLLLIPVLLLGCKAKKEPDLFIKYSQQIEYASTFMDKENANREYIYLVDFSIHSGKNRMFLVNIPKKKIIAKYTVSHGRGNKERNARPISFSNTENSLCSSVGVGLINGREYSNWGNHVKYWVDGLEATNSNMRKRVVVIHSFQMVSHKETYPLPLVKSEGCFMISIKGMEEIDKFIKSQSNKKILIYSFN